MPEAVNKAQFFEAVLRCVADGVFTVDCNWRISSFNRAAEGITGVPAEGAIGRRCSEVGQLVSGTELPGSTGPRFPGTNQIREQ